MKTITDYLEQATSFISFSEKLWTSFKNKTNLNEIKSMRRELKAFDNFIFGEIAVEATVALFYDIGSFQIFD